ncbi:MAG TPA: hypothetical protein VF116_06005 [Ktedonobacterales bacterium]
MRWLPWRRKPAHAESDERSGGVAVADRPARSTTPSRPAVEPRGAALAFARDALALSGAQVRVEDPDLLAVALPDGTRARYTGSLARARGEAEATLLVQGGAALDTLLDEVAQRGGCVAFTLPQSSAPLALASTAVAEPPAGCGHCVSGADAENVALCATCPLRAGRLALAGVRHVEGVREVGRSEAVAVELTYRVVYRDRDGRRDELHRLAYDVAAGEPVAAVAPDALANCAPCPLPADVGLASIAQRTQDDLMRMLDAGASLLALRAEAEYQRQLHDLALTHARLLRESPETRADLEASHTAERARLADLFAVSAEAELAGVAYVSTSLAEVAVRHAGGELGLKVDLGRGEVLPPRCAVCATPSRAGTLCAHGHLVCPVCAAERDAAACPACEAGAGLAAGQLATRRGPRAAAGRAGDDFTAERLADLSEPVWQAFVSWYLADAGYEPEPPHVWHGLSLWRLGKDTGEGSKVGADTADSAGSGFAIAVRTTDGRRLGAADVRATLDACRDRPCQVDIVVSSAVAGDDALREVAAAGVRVVDRDALAAFLARAATAHATALAEAERDVQACADAAHETQVALLGALAALEKEIAGCANTRRATGRGPLTTATNTATAALHEAERALLAWDTLIADWLASFDERPAADGSLRITRTPDELRMLAERTGHLRAALGRPLAALAATPGVGESGYTAWRKALLEQLTAACETLSWRASAVNLEHWRDAASAHDAAALAHAEAAAQRAKHTAGRTAKARDVLAGRIGL